MKFYFCETCGTRLTEHDIEGGVAKNKKLKGVYCNACAVGVTTMESLPLSDKEARKVLEKAAPHSGSPDGPQRANRRSSGVALPARRPGATRTQSARKPSVASPTQSPHAKLVVPAIVVAMVVIGGLVLLGGQGRPSTAKKSRAPKDGTRKRDAVKREDPPHMALAAGSVTDSHAPVERTAGPASPKASSPTGPKSDAKATSTHSPAPTQPSQVPEKSTQVAQPEPQKTEPIEAPSGPSESDVAKARFNTYLKAFDQAVGKKNLVDACKVAERAKSDPALKAIEKEVASLERIGQALSEAAESRQRALAALTDGKKRSFQTAKGTLLGTVRKIEGDTLKLMVEGSINKQTIEYEKRVKLADLTPDCRAKVLGEKRPATPDEWMADVVRCIVAENLVSAEQSLKEAPSHPLKPHYRYRIDSLRLGEREAAAKRAWEERISPLLKMTEFTKAGARAGEKVLGSFLNDHGKTAFAESVAKQVKALEAAIRATLGPPRELTFDLGGGVKMEFVLIPAGTFMMGNEVQHKVTLTKGFYMGKYEVTQAQYQRLMGNNPSPVKGPDLPVVRVNWKDCHAFCRKLSEKTGRKARLPTEAEWEYACRAGTTTRYSFGDSDAEFDAYGWSVKNSGGKAHPVGQKKPNKFGLYDMHGNVWERLQDWYGAYPTEAVTDPKGPRRSSHRVVRGGSWRHVPSAGLSGRRGKDPNNDRGLSDGVRVALDL